MTPPVVTTETIHQQGQKPVIQFRLFDSNSNQTFKHVTYFITIEKGDKKLLFDTFHDHSGDLRLEIKPMNTSISNSLWRTRSYIECLYRETGNPVIASGPIFLQGGLYHFIYEYQQ